MFNYIKFVIYQFLFILRSIPLLHKIKNDSSKSSSDYIYNQLHIHARKSLKIVGINVKVLGEENIPKEAVLFISNHSSMLDSFILLSSINRPTGFVISDEGIWKSIPIFSTWANLIKCVYINRKDNREAIKSIQKSANNISKGQSMAVFPEGDLTWVKDPNAIISSFRSGALKIAYKSKCPIIPFVIKNSKDTYDGYQPVGAIKSMNVEVEFLEPIYDHIADSSIKTSILGEEIRTSMINKIREYEH